MKKREFIIERKPMPNGYIKVSAIDVETGVEDYTLVKFHSTSALQHSEKVAVSKLIRRLGSS